MTVTGLGLRVHCDVEVLLAAGQLRDLTMIVCNDLEAPLMFSYLALPFDNLRCKSGLREVMQIVICQTLQIMAFSLRASAECVSLNDGYVGIFRCGDLRHPHGVVCDGEYNGSRSQ